MISALIALLVVILIVGLIAGLVVYLIDSAPFIPAAFKQPARWIVIVIAVLIIILRALPLLGVSV